MPTDQSALVSLMDHGTDGKIGEGRRVRLVAFIIDTKAGSSESVNCNRTKIANNNIHIALGKSYDDDKWIPLNEWDARSPEAEDN